MAEVFLVTGREMPKPETETALLVGALRDRGVTAEIRPWGEGTDWAATDLVVIRTTWDYTEHVEDFLSWAAAVDSQTTLLNPLAALRWNSHKGYLLELQSAGVPVVTTVVVPRGATTAEQRAGLRVDGDVVIKPAVSAGARDTVRVAATDPSATEHLAGLVDRGDVLVQPYLDSIEADGEVSLMFFGGELSHAVLKRPAVGDFRTQPHLGGSVEPHRASADEMSVAAAALRAGATLAGAAGSPACARVDLVTSPGGPLLMELELIEPYLFLDTDPGAADRLAAVLVDSAR
jgi:glutathione synthase/RimK-type ligase-like ATP-grasp enzyme